jgi:hypothetical protein
MREQTRSGQEIAGMLTKTTNQENLEETSQTFIKVWERVPYVSIAAVQSAFQKPLCD